MQNQGGFAGLMLLRYRLPRGMRYSVLKERKEFYQKEFNIEKLKEWFDDRNGRGTIKFAVIIGRHTRIFPEKYRDDASTTIIIDEYKDFDDVKAQILEFLPESAYYDRNGYDEKQRVAGQELAFDLDPENLTCPIHGSLADKMKRHQGLAFCELELNMVKDEAIKLNEELEKVFSDMHVVYSGRGFHIHVFDSEPFLWSYKQRQALARRLKKKGFLIDEWVTTGGMRLIRLPYSLHGMVSRIALPIEATQLAEFDPVTDGRCVPRFLTQSTSSLCVSS
jgi:DNA primase catalytic subunit